MLVSVHYSAKCKFILICLTLIYYYMTHAVSLLDLISHFNREILTHTICYLCHSFTFLIVVYIYNGLRLIPCSPMGNVFISWSSIYHMAFFSFSPSFHFFLPLFLSSFFLLSILPFISFFCLLVLQTPFQK